MVQEVLCHGEGVVEGGCHGEGVVEGGREAVTH